MMSSVSSGSKVRTRSAKLSNVLTGHDVQSIQREEREYGQKKAKRRDENIETGVSE